MHSKQLYSSCMISVLLSFLLLFDRLQLSLADYSPPECPYPCLPPPTSSGVIYPSPPPPPPTWGYGPPQPGTPYTGSYPPPPAGYLPYYPPPSYYTLPAPPPPNPILPWFPFYYRSPPSSSSTARAGAITFVPLMITVLLSILLW